MLKNFWYACEFSSAVTNKPKQIVMLNQRFVLYRDSQGQVVALNDQCPHRGAALSLGQVEDGCIHCPYHGWKFQADGHCIDIPANQPGVPIPKKARVDTYSVQEKYGFVWLFYGDLPETERPPIPLLPEFADSTLHPIFLEYKMNAHYTRVIENSLCPAHISVVHSDSFGWGFTQDQKVEEYDVDEEPWGVSAVITYENFTKPKGFFRLFFQPSRTKVQSKTTFYLPNITKVVIDFGRGKLVNYAIHLPIDDNTTLSKRIQFRSFFTYSWADPIFVKFHHKVGMEDRVVTESEYPKRIPENLASEAHTPADALPLAFRKLRQKYLAMGWGLEPSSDNSNNLKSHPVEPTATLSMN
ncbi:MAG: aromatic ring-hydroxylating dioxygenase subunit alpha [Trichocoleus desertorum ATA4-8-CV12]|jgi:phenylpropionate dioxygenase-like ring-hydroxylating dioxygenase large terminal subunit|nr:aromatic ring-hydroxylating dioxygenase subunit alpha [Trichocoleus desertorum ATA4-8-CV12]